jgi:hypothetical protein
MIRRIFFLLVNLFLILPGDAAAQDIVRSGTYVRVRSRDNNRRWFLRTDNSGKLELRTSPYSYFDDADLFLLVKVGGSPGEELRDGDYIQMRGTIHDPWLHPEARAGVVRTTPRPQERLFVEKMPVDYIFSVTNRRLPDPIKFGDAFRIRGTTSDPWFVQQEGREVEPITLTQQKSAASAFVFLEYATGSGNRFPVAPAPRPSTPNPPNPGPSPSRRAVPPTFRVQETGSWILVYATNTGTVAYSCSFSFRWTRAQGGAGDTGTEQGSFVVLAGTRDGKVIDFGGAVVNLRSTSDIRSGIQCNAN